MIVDTSAVVAVLRCEPGWERLDHLLTSASSTSMSAASYVELGVVVDRGGDPTLARRADTVLDMWRVEIAAVTPEQARIARTAYRDYGKGSVHPAKLNYGDCFSYALASATGEPLLFVGDDFTHTDLVAA